MSRCLGDRTLWRLSEGEGNREERAHVTFCLVCAARLRRLEQDLKGAEPQTHASDEPAVAVSVAADDEALLENWLVEEGDHVVDLGPGRRIAADGTWRYQYEDVTTSRALLSLVGPAARQHRHPDRDSVHEVMARMSAPVGARFSAPPSRACWAARSGCS